MGVGVSEAGVASTAPGADVPGSANNRVASPEAGSAFVPGVSMTCQATSSSWIGRRFAFGSAEDGQTSGGFGSFDADSAVAGWLDSVIRFPEGNPAWAG